MEVVLGGLVRHARQVHSSTCCMAKHPCVLIRSYLRVCVCACDSTYGRVSFIFRDSHCSQVHRNFMKAARLHAQTTFSLPHVSPVAIFTSSYSECLQKLLSQRRKGVANTSQRTCHSAIHATTQLCARAHGLKGGTYQSEPRMSFTTYQALCTSTDTPPAAGSAMADDETGYRNEVWPRLRPSSTAA